MAKRKPQEFLNLLDEPKKRKLGIRAEIMELGEPHENYNADITKILSQLATIEKNKGQRHKFTAYSTAVGSLSGHKERVASAEEAKKLDGVGAKIAKKIQEILDTGRLRKLEKYLADPKIVALNTLCKVHGVGPKAAAKWVDEGIMTIEQLKKQKLNHQQQIGVQYYEDIQQRISRDEMDEHFALIKSAIKKVDPEGKIRVECCGSYRRGRPDSGDIDILLTHPEFVLEKADPLRILQSVIGELNKRKYLLADLANGIHQYMGVCRLPPKKSNSDVLMDVEGQEAEKRVARRIDFKIFPVRHFFPALLHFTGSGEHNRQLSCIAINKGFRLGEYSLSPVGCTGVVGEPILVNSEEEIFAMLGIPYKTPEQRSL